MAAPFAYEEPTLNKSWQAFVNHLPTIIMIWVVTAILSVAGLLAYYAVAYLAPLIITSGNPEPGSQATAFGALLGNAAQIPFSIASSFVSVLITAVPALYYESGRNISPHEAFSVLFRRPLRYFLAGLFFSIACGIGLLFCLLPGIAIALVMPVYTNRIFNTNESIPDTFVRSFKSVYQSERGFTFIIIQILAGLCVVLSTVCTCFLGALVAIPVGIFYVQNAAYRHGMLR